MEGVLEGDWQPEEGSVRADAIQGMADASEEIERIQENMQNVQSEIGDSGASAEQRRLLDDYAEEMRQQQQILDKHS
ncbi:DUF4175 domain-containing protein, partial [Salmonella enterica]|uniref:DUF4175 domain-containing protein n=1 Tax=Salmonella enterica TaxID=28901 RepID=UPI0010F655AF